MCITTYHFTPQDKHAYIVDYHGDDTKYCQSDGDLAGARCRILEMHHSTHCCALVLVLVVVLRCCFETDYGGGGGGVGEGK